MVDRCAAMSEREERYRRRSQQREEEMERSADWTAPEDPDEAVGGAESSDEEISFTSPMPNVDPTSSRKSPFEPTTDPMETKASASPVGTNTPIVRPSPITNPASDRGNGYGRGRWRTGSVARQERESSAQGIGRGWMAAWLQKGNRKSDQASKREHAAAQEEPKERLEQVETELMKEKRRMLQAGIDRQRIQRELERDLQAAENKERAERAKQDEATKMKIERLRLAAEKDIALALKREELAATAKLEEARLKVEKEKEEAKLKLQEKQMEEDRKLQEKLEMAKINNQKLADDKNLEIREQKLREPKVEIPRWNDRDDPERYLDQYEHIAGTYKWRREDWCDRLFPYVSGVLRNLLADIPADDRRNWDLVREAVLAYYNRTPEWYRTQFRSMKKESQETFPTYACRLEDMAEKWMRAAGVDRSDADQLWQAFMKERFMQTLWGAMAREVARMECKTVKEAAKEAQRIFEIDRQYPRPTTPKEPNKGPKMPAESAEEAQRARQQPQMRGQQPLTQGEQIPNTLVQTQLPGRGRGSFRPRGRGTPGPSSRCYSCGSAEHHRNQCPRWEGSRINVARDASVRMQVQGPSPLCEPCARKPLAVWADARLNGRPTQALRDTGANQCVVCPTMVKEEDLLKDEVCVTLADGAIKSVKQAFVDIDSPWIVGRVRASVLQGCKPQLLIGNEAVTAGGERVPVPVYANTTVLAAVQTRKQAAQRKEKGRDRSPGCQAPQRLITEVDSTPEDFARCQRQDATLTRAVTMADSGEVVQMPGGQVSYCWKGGAVHRIYRSSAGEEVSQLCVPKSFRRKVLELAHDMPMGGHLGENKTRDRVYSQFTWPGVRADVKRHVGTCDACQRTTPRGRTPRFPMQHMPIVGEPFELVGVDLIGPLPPSSTGMQYVLVLVDHATRYPEAVPLRNMTAKTVAKALIEIFQRMGIPKVMLTDQGTQFTGELMRGVQEILEIEAKFTTAYHPQTNGVVERFNGTLKAMLRRLTQEKPRTWDCFVAPALFAFREVPQETTGFSPFELMFGRKVRGPMAVLHDLWTKDEQPQPVKIASKYVCELRERIAETCKLARENLRRAAKTTKEWYDRKATPRDIGPGDDVLLLLPEKHNKLELAWQGPYRVEDKIGPCNFRVRTRKGVKLVHGNMLKKYHHRLSEEQSTGRTRFQEGDQMMAVRAISVVDGEGEPVSQLGDDVPTFPLDRTEGPESVKLDAENRERHADLMSIVRQYPKVLSDLPGKTKLSPCRIELTDDGPIRVKQYPLPHSQRDAIAQEVKEMLRLGVIEPSTSPYTSPVVIVKKKDGKNRFCVDYRQLNKKVKFDAEPMPDVEHLFASVGRGKILSKLDLAKGYWQVPVVPEDRPKTAFATSEGLFQWTVVPFGLSTSGAVFSRVMRELILPLGMPEISNFIDDILIVTDTWERHFECLQALFSRMQQMGMTVKPSKCLLGHRQLPYLGYVVGGATIRPEEEKVEKIRAVERPRTKKQLRSFLGLTGFYRRFCPNYAVVALPLTNATKKAHSHVLRWNDQMEEAFQKLKSFLTSEPLCVLPDVDRPFVLRTDASEEGLGAVLLQDHGAGLQPIAYASKKLTGPERNYSTIEKECLGVVWGVKRFEPYLFARSFVLQVDHNPLVYMSRLTPVNARLLRWALFLQQYRFEVQAIPGKMNVDADYLSRFASPVKPVRIEETSGGLLSQPRDMALACCVTEGMDACCATPPQFLREMGVSEELRSQRKKSGEVAATQAGGRWIYALVLAREPGERPAWKAVRKAIRALGVSARSHGVTQLALPRVAVKQNGLDPTRVRSLIDRELTGRLESITICDQ